MKCHKLLLTIRRKMTRIRFMAIIIIIIPLADQHLKSAFF